MINDSCGFKGIVTTFNLSTSKPENEPK